MAKEVEKGAQSGENQRKLAEFLANMALPKEQSIKASMELREFLHKTTQSAVFFFFYVEWFIHVLIFR